jgi:hypothetical protein
MGPTEGVNRRVIAFGQANKLAKIAAFVANQLQLNKIRLVLASIRGCNETNRNRRFSRWHGNAHEVGASEGLA